jgi:uncharacterized protein
MTETRNERTQANRRTIRRAFEARQERNGTVTDVFAPDMVWRIEGRSVATGEYGSKQRFVDEVLAPFGARFSSSSDPFRAVTIRSIHADGDIVIVLWDGRGIAKRRPALREQLRLVHEDRDGKVVDGTAFYDSIAFTSSLGPRPSRALVARLVTGDRVRPPWTPWTAVYTCRDDGDLTANRNAGARASRDNRQSARVLPGAVMSPVRGRSVARPRASSGDPRAHRRRCQRLGFDNERARARICNAVERCHRAVELLPLTRRRAERGESVKRQL